MKKVACPLCLDGGERHASGAHADGRPWSLRMCRECGLAFADPLEHPGGAWYGASSQYADRDGDTPLGSPEEGWRHRQFFSVLRRPGRVLDVGCGDGEFLAIAGAAGWSTAGLDVDPRAVRRAAEGRGVRGVSVADVRDGLRHLGDDFDAVTAFDLVEHVPDPLGLVREMAECARPGGAVFVAVPRLDRAPPVFDEIVDRPPHHLTLWTERALQRLLVDSGLVDVRVIARPLVHHDLLNMYAWARQRSPDGFRRDGAYFARNLICRARVAAGRLAGTTRGHTLLAHGRAPAPDTSRPA